MKTTRMKTILVTALLSALFLLPSSGYAQRWYTGLTYDVSFPTGDLKEYTDEISWRGFGMTFRTAMKEDVTVGATLGWHVFYERTNETLQLESGAASGTQDRYVNAFPMMLNAHYYLGDRGGTRPFIGMNFGGMYVSQRFDMGIRVLERDSFEWAMAPEVGVAVPLQRNTLLLLAAKYNVALSGESIAGRNFEVGYWGISVGFAWAQH